MAKQQVAVELYYDAAWHDHTVLEDVRTKHPIQIAHGRGSEQSEPTPSTCTVTFDNRNGEFNPRNPSSSLFGKIGRNTRLRVSVGTEPRLEDDFNRSVTNGWTGGGIPWTLSGGSNPNDWDVNGSKGTITHTDVGTLRYSYVDCGQDDHRVTARFNVGTGDITGAAASIWLVARMTDLNNYYTLVVNFSTSETITAQLFKRVGGVGSALGSAGTLSGSPFTGAANQDLIADLYVEGNKIFGNLSRVSTGNLSREWDLVAEDDDLPTGSNAGVTGRRETGNTNSNLQLQFDNVVVVPGTIRFAGEVSSWKPRRELGGDAWTEVTASGILRRLGQGARPLRSALWRETLANAPVALWPVNDGESAPFIASALQGGSPLSIFARDFDSGAVVAAEWTSVSYNDWLEPLAEPPLETKLIFTGPIPMSTSTLEWGGDFVFAISPDIDPSAGGVAVTWQGTGSYYSDANPRVDWSLVFEGGVWALVRYRWTFTSPSSTIVDSDTLTYNTGEVLHARLTTVRDGSDVDWEVRVNNSVVGSGTLVGSDWETLTGVEAVVGTTNSGTAALGFLTVWDTASPPQNAANAAVVGRSGELAGDRFTRLCDEEGITYTVVGDTADTEPMGPQRLVTLLENLLDVEDVDMGQLFDTRQQLGLTYRTRVDLYNQTAALALDEDAQQVAAPLDPDIDDLGVVNDVTVSRPNGSSARSVQETGPLNVQDPRDDPDGIGVYDVDEQVNVDSDAQLQGIADWRRHAGTIDEVRYPRVSIDLDASPELSDDASRLEIGDRFTLDSLPDQPDQSAQLALGTSETIGSHRRVMALNATPAALFDVGVFDDAGTRYDSAYSTTAAQITTGTSTSLSVAIEAGRALWVTGSGSPQFPLDLDLAGARVRVTAIAGTSSPQTFTISTSVVNGVAKVIPSGTPVRLATPKRYAL